MFVKHMSTDEWEGIADHGTEVDNPTWEQVKEAIIALDGKRKTMVIISDREKSEHYMIIAGQWDGRYIVNATKDNRKFFCLVDPTRSRKEITLYVGGQDGDYQERLCVPQAWALEAAEYFYQTGELKPTMNWTSDYH